MSKTKPPLPFVDGLKGPKKRSSSLSVHFPLSKMPFSWSCCAKPSPELQKFKRQESSPSATPGFLGPHREGVDHMPGTTFAAPSFQDAGSEAFWGWLFPVIPVLFQTLAFPTTWAHHILSHHPVLYSSCTIQNYMCLFAVCPSARQCQCQSLPIVS